MNEVRITSAFDFFKIAHGIRTERREKEHVSCIEFFRGHAISDWKVVPSLYRWYSRDGQNSQISLSSFEKPLIDEFCLSRPDEFPSSLHAFDKLTKMQHYGMQTRLLDVTSNPAVALYFACCEQYGTEDVKDGEVFIFRTTLDEILDNDTINLIAEHCIMSHRYGGSISDFYQHCLKSYPRAFVDQAFSSLIFQNEFFARPKVISERMLRQSGFFILCTGLLCPDSGCKNSICKVKKCKNRDGDEIGAKRYPIEEKVKHYSLKNSYYDSTDFNYSYHQEGLRYIIDGRSKKRILSELNTIGINQAFLFPELQYESKRILDDYMSRVT